MLFGSYVESMSKKKKELIGFEEGQIYSSFYLSNVDVTKVSLAQII